MHTMPPPLRRHTLPLRSMPPSRSILRTTTPTRVLLLTLAPRFGQELLRIPRMWLRLTASQVRSRRQAWTRTLLPPPWRAFAVRLSTEVCCARRLPPRTTAAAPPIAVQKTSTTTPVLKLAPQPILTARMAPRMALQNDADRAMVPPKDTPGHAAHLRPAHPGRRPSRPTWIRWNVRTGTLLRNRDSNA